MLTCSADMSTSSTGYNPTSVEPPDEIGRDVELTLRDVVDKVAAQATLDKKEAMRLPRGIVEMALDLDRVDIHSLSLRDAQLLLTVIREAQRAEKYAKLSVQCAESRAMCQTGIDPVSNRPPDPDHKNTYVESLLSPDPTPYTPLAVAHQPVLPPQDPAPAQGDTYIIHRPIARRAVPLATGPVSITPPAAGSALALSALELAPLFNRFPPRSLALTHAPSSHSATPTPRTHKDNSLASSATSHTSPAKSQASSHSCTRTPATPQPLKKKKKTWNNPPTPSTLKMKTRSAGRVESPLGDVSPSSQTSTISEFGQKKEESPVIQASPSPRTPTFSKTNPQKKRTTVNQTKSASHVESPTRTVSSSSMASTYSRSSSRTKTSSAIQTRLRSGDGPCVESPLVADSTSSRTSGISESSLENKRKTLPFQVKPAVVWPIAREHISYSTKGVHGIWRWFSQKYPGRALEFCYLQRCGGGPYFRVRCAFCRTVKDSYHRHKREHRPGSVASVRMDEESWWDNPDEMEHICGFPHNKRSEIVEVFGSRIVDDLLHNADALNKNNIVNAESYLDQPKMAFLSSRDREKLLPIVATAMNDIMKKRHNHATSNKRLREMVETGSQPCIVQPEDKKEDERVADEAAEEKESEMQAQSKEMCGEDLLVIVKTQDGPDSEEEELRDAGVESARDGCVSERSPDMDVSHDHTYGSLCRIKAHQRRSTSTPKRTTGSSNGHFSDDEEQQSVSSSVSGKVRGRGRPRKSGKAALPSTPSAAVNEEPSEKRVRSSPYPLRLRQMSHKFVESVDNDCGLTD